MTQTVTGFAVVAIQNIVDGVANNFLNILNFSGVANAVNSVTVTNAATANGPSVAAVGSDTDIDLKLTGKGAGKVRASTGGPLLPSSTYLGGAGGNLSPNFYIPATNTNGAGAIEGIGVVASLASDAAAILQFNIPENVPTGTLKLRCLAMANAVAGVAKLTVSDGATPAGSNIGATTLTAETQLSQTWATADILVENKITLTTVPAANSILTVKATFNTTGWTLAAASTWQFSLVWE